MARFHRRGRRAHGGYGSYSGWVGRDKERKLSPYNKFVKANAKKFRLKNGKIDMRALGRAWKAHNKGTTYQHKGGGRASFQRRLHSLRNLVGSVAGRKKGKKGHKAHHPRKMSDAAKLKAISVELKRLGDAYERAVKRANSKAEKSRLRKEAFRKKAAARKAAKAAKSGSASAQKAAVAAAYAEHARRGQHSHPLAGLSGLNFMGGSHSDEEALRNKYGGDRKRRKKAKSKKSKRKGKFASKRHPSRSTPFQGKKYHKKRKSPAKKRSSKRAGVKKRIAGLKRYHAFMKKAKARGMSKGKAKAAWKKHNR